MEVRGPKAKALKDESGQWTIAAKKFCEAKGVNPEDIYTKKQGKHDYAFVRVHIEGEPLSRVAGDVFEKAVKAIPFGKTMTWEYKVFPFSRPIRWILALHGDRVVPIEFQLKPADEFSPAESIRGGRMSRGHRRLAEQSFEVSHAECYQTRLRENMVIVDRSERRALMLEQIHRLAGERELVFDEKEERELIEEVTDLVEMPHPVLGTVPEAALDLREEIVVTPMRQHQRYFPLRNGDGSLSKHFICVANGDFSKDAKARRIIVEGNEKVLNARLRDALFFWESDGKQSLAQHGERLDTIVFHKDLGTMADKVARMKALAKRLSYPSGAYCKENELQRVLELMKADLTTQMVCEFTSLEGLVGKLYGEREGLDPILTQALYEHRLPRRAGDVLPASKLGAVASLVDRLDTLIAYLGLGLRPSGSRDPLGLRRNALAFLQVLREFEIDIDLLAWAKASMETFPSGELSRGEETAKLFLDFMTERLALTAKEEGYEHSLVQAALSSHCQEPLAFDRCLRALRDWDDAALQELAEHSKRIEKIAVEPAELVDQTLLQEQSEHSLFQTLSELGPSIAEAVEVRDFERALSFAERFVPRVVEYFDEVLVNDERVEIRRNRHRFLRDLLETMKKVADFTKIEKRG